MRALGPQLWREQSRGGGQRPRGTDSPAEVRAHTGGHGRQRGPHPEMGWGKDPGRRSPRDRTAGRKGDLGSKEPVKEARCLLSGLVRLCHMWVPLRVGAVSLASDKHTTLAPGHSAAQSLLPASTLQAGH